MLGEEHAPKFRDMLAVTVGNGATRQSPIYRFPKREACLMGMICRLLENPKKTPCSGRSLCDRRTFHSLCGTPVLAARAGTVIDTRLGSDQGGMEPTYAGEMRDSSNFLRPHMPYLVREAIFPVCESASRSQGIYKKATSS